MVKNFSSYFVLIFMILFSLDGVHAEDVAERFSDYDPNSKVRINHQPLTDYLKATVLPVGRSWRIQGNEKSETYRGSRIKTSKALSPSRFEGGRMIFHAFTEDHVYFFQAYQKGLENLSSRRPISTLNKNEQLAYWLNLYNVIVINKLTKEYPISNLKRLRSTKPGKTSFWDEKVTTVEGVPLSLNDIETILFSNFDQPEVAFGLWQGSIGGPKLNNYAFNGRNVIRALESNALEFVNSNRGLRPPTGTRMSVSDFYEWTMPAFGSSEVHVLMFIKEYADPNFVSGVSNVTNLNFKIYDWTIADLVGGVKHSGQHNQMGGVLTGGTNGHAASPGSERQVNDIGPSLSFAPGSGVSVGLNSLGNMKEILNLIPTGPQEGLPTHALETLMGIQQTTRAPTTQITTYECAPDEDCVIENLGGEDGGG